VPISSEWSRTGDGRIDLWIPQKKWGIELLRDHNRVSDHCDRFKEGGIYHSWVKAGKLKDWIIIDCATSFPASEHPEPRLWRAVFDDNFSKLLLLDHKNNQFAGPAVLTN